MAKKAVIEKPAEESADASAAAPDAARARAAADLAAGVRPVEAFDMSYTRFERARIIGARALQIAMGAPIIISVPNAELLDPVRVAEKEFREAVIPITVLRPEAGHRRRKRPEIKVQPSSAKRA